MRITIKTGKTELEYIGEDSGSSTPTIVREPSLVYKIKELIGCCADAEEKRLLQECSE